MADGSYKRGGTLVATAVKTAEFFGEGSAGPLRGAGRSTGITARECPASNKKGYIHAHNDTGSRSGAARGRGTRLRGRREGTVGARRVRRVRVVGRLSRVAPQEP